MEFTKMCNKQSIPVVVVSPLPFVMVKSSEDDEWNPDLEQINNSTFDYVKLNRISLHLNVGLTLPLHGLVCFDGSYVLPLISSYQDNMQNAVDQFNKIFGYLAIGGILYEAIDARSISFARVRPCFKYIGNNNPSSDFGANVRIKFRMGDSHSIETMTLLDCKYYLSHQIRDAYNLGKGVFDSIPNLSAKLILKSLTAIVRHNWEEALYLGWICIEQLVEHLWNEKMIKPSAGIKVQKRKDFLRDTGSWTMSTKLELLYSISALDIDIYKKVYTVRQCRNDYVHRGKTVLEQPARQCIDSVLEIISSICSKPEKMLDFTKLLGDLDKEVSKSTREKHEGPIDQEMIKFWRYIKPGPGDIDWKTNEYKFPIEVECDKCDIQVELCKLAKLQQGRILE